MHILGASGIPIYSFFGPTSWVRSHVAGQRNRVFSAEVECSPCFKGKCPPKKVHICMNKITPKHVFLKIAQEMQLGIS